MTKAEIVQYYYLKREAENAESLAKEIGEKRATATGEDLLFLNRQIQRLQQKKVRSMRMHEQIEEYVDSISDCLTRQVVYERYIRGKTWTAVAMAVGGGNTPDSVRKISERFLEKCS